MHFKKILVPKINVVYNWITNLQTSILEKNLTPKFLVQMLYVNEVFKKKFIPKIFNTKDLCINIFSSFSKKFPFFFTLIL
jgi:hypothetical protein